MKVHFRTSPTFPILSAGVGIVIGLVAALGRSNPFTIFLGTWGIFLLGAFVIWATSEILFEDDKIIRHILFLYDRAYPLSDVKRVEFNNDEDNFGGRSTYVTIKFNNGRTFILQGFVRSDLEEIARRIRSVMPNAIDSSLDRFLERPPKELRRSLQDSLRPGDKFIFVGGVIFVLIFVAWWIWQTFAQ
jgi:hypothetical protein